MRRAGRNAVLATPLVAALALAGCATPAERITDHLEAAGVPVSQARCMGSRLANRLTIGQMAELSRIAKDRRGDRLTVAALARRLGDADPALVDKLIETGLPCAI